MTMISSEVAPFLILAIGVDNMFIIYNSFKRQNRQLSIQQRLALGMREVGPSITAATICEFLTFISNFIITSWCCIHTNSCSGLILLLGCLFCSLRLHFLNHHFCLFAILDLRGSRLKQA